MRPTVLLSMVVAIVLLVSRAEAAALAAVLPNGTARYVALLTTLPAADGTGEVEATGSSYARKSYSAWLTSVSSGITYRKNNGAIEFTALTGALTGVLGWAIYDASTAGNLLAFGYIRDSSGAAVTKNFVNTDQPRFLDQELKVGLGEAA